MQLFNEKKEELMNCYNDCQQSQELISESVNADFFIIFSLITSFIYIYMLNDFEIFATLFVYFCK